MNPFEMVLGIIVVVMIARVLRDRHRAQAMTAQRAPDQEVARMADELARLRERVQVLERVITDGRGGSELDREIERLRDR